ncbi:MAG: hypothetical protein ACHQAQ_14145 [Hyphomicrobiales bacterium]
MATTGVVLRLQGINGMAFLTPVTLRHPGVLGIGFTDTFVVTETGCEAPTARDRTLTVAAV